jgi:hypothetical protein
MTGLPSGPTTRAADVLDFVFGVPVIRSILQREQFFYPIPYRNFLVMQHPVLVFPKAPSWVWHVAISTLFRRRNLTLHRILDVDDEVVIYHRAPVFLALD